MNSFEVIKNSPLYLSHFILEIECTWFCLVLDSRDRYLQIFQFGGIKNLNFQMGLFIMDHSVARGLAKLHVSDHTSTTLCACVIACR